MIKDIGPINFASSSEIRKYPRLKKEAPCYQKAWQKLCAFGHKPWEKLWGIVQKPLKNQIFYASSTKFKAKIEEPRLEESRSILRQLGGQTQLLKTSDGVTIEAMYFNVTLFKERVCELGGQFTYEIQTDGKPQQILNVFTHSLKTLCDKMRIDLKLQLGRGWMKKLSRPENEAFPLVQSKQPSVTILTQGNAGIFEFDRARIADTLLTGQNCIVYNLRGTGRSKGTPSEIGSYRDLEAVYQYLTQVKRFHNKQITILGYCLGGGASTELAKNHPGISLTMDRCFLSMGDMVSITVADYAIELLKCTDQSKMEKIKKFSRFLIAPVAKRLLFGYQNLDKLSKVEGRVCIIDASEDDVIPPDTGPRLRKAVRSEHTAITLQGEHCDPWDDTTWDAYLKHLKEGNKVRNFGQTPFPTQREGGRKLDFAWSSCLALKSGQVSKKIKASL